MTEKEFLDEKLIRLFVRRDGKLSIAFLKNGREAIISNIAWGYDIGDQYAHITTNISPEIEGLEIDFFFTNEITELLDYEHKYPLMDFPI